MVIQLKNIHHRNFAAASEAIGIYQDKYKKQYDKKHNVHAINWKIGDKVQYARYASKKPKSKSALSRWSPLRSYYEIYKINFEKKQMILNNREGTILKKPHPFDRIRRYRGV